MTARAGLAIAVASLALIALLRTLRDADGPRTVRPVAAPAPRDGAPAREIAPQVGSRAEGDPSVGTGQEEEAAAARAGAALALRVVEEGSGRALAGARVDFWSFPGPFQGGGTTGIDGTFRGKGAPDVAYVIDVHPPADRCELLAGIRVIARGLGPHEIRLRPGLLLAVRVRDEWGALPTGPLHAFWQVLDGSAGRMGADRGGSRPLAADGTARLVVPECPVGVGVASLDDAGVYAWTAPVDPTAGDITVVLYRGEPVRFRVVDEEEAESPAGVIHYRICREGEPFERPFAHGTTARGTTESRPLPPGRYDVYVMACESTENDRLLAWGETPGVAAGGEPADVPLVRSRRIAGRVRTAERRVPAQPVTPRMSLDHEGEGDGTSFGGTVTVADGRFAFEGLPPGPVRVDLRDPRSLVAAPLRGVLAGRMDLVLEVQPATSIGGRVEWAGWTGRYGGRIHVGPRRSAKLLEDGSFELTGLPHGPVRLEWWAQGSRIADLGEVEAPAEGVVLRVSAP